MDDAVNQLGQLPAKKKSADEIARTSPASPMPMGYGEQIRNVGGFFAGLPGKALGFVASAPGYGGPFSSKDGTTALPPAPTKAATYSPNEGNNYKAGMGPLQSPAVSTSQAAPPPEAGSNAALALQNPAGRVTKTVDANGRVTYSGQNVSGDVSFMGGDGKPLAGAPRGGFMVTDGSGGARQQLSAGFGPMAGTSPNAAYRPDGKVLTDADNKIMAANIRDGINPMAGIGSGPQVSIMTNSAAPTAGEKYIQKMESAPRALRDLSTAQLNRILTNGAQIDATNRQGGNEAARLNLQAQELSFKQQDAATRLALDGQRFGLDTARFSAEQPRRDAELTGMGMKNQEGKGLIDARDAYMNAPEGSPEQKAAMKKLQILSGKFDKPQSEWIPTRVKVGADKDGNPIEMVARTNKTTGETIMPEGYGLKGGAGGAKPGFEVGKTYPRTLADGSTVNARFMGDGKWAEVK